VEVLIGIAAIVLAIILLPKLLRALARGERAPDDAREHAMHTGWYAIPGAFFIAGLFHGDVHGSDSSQGAGSDFGGSIGGGFDGGGGGFDGGGGGE
jgi:uncharacterized membrane protein YgcG